MIPQYKEKYRDALLDTNRDLAFEIIDEAIGENISPESVIFDILLPGMEDLAEIIRKGQDATLAQLYIASQISSEVTDRLVPKFTRNQEVGGTVVIGTAFEDFHGLGKKIVSGCLKSRMIKVVDLGLNVTAEKYIEEAINHKADVIGVSSMMVHTARGDNGPVKIRELLHKEGLGKQIKLVVGGAPYRFHHEMYKEVGADAWADNGIDAATVITELIKEAAAI